MRKESCDDTIRKGEEWKAFQKKSGVIRDESDNRYKLNAIIEFYCSNCQITEGEKGGGGGDDVMPPQIQTKKASLIENNPEEKEEGEKDEFEESSEQGGIEEIKQLGEGTIEIITKLLEQKKEEKRKLLKEDKSQENDQKIKRLEEEIKKLEKELDEVRKNSKLSLGTLTRNFSRKSGNILPSNQPSEPRLAIISAT
ncbi:4621_t:CDS:2 [Ambispora leptoticha]|uniref:4621_t:CDS:1 n=1 Tax=Ambispora leptoticha TaxID=144679 RepID=A0A9N9D0P6_9GLOM|nr:4621_t:CDS:2 [Ambispora leptoticha]